MTATSTTTRRRGAAANDAQVAFDFGEAPARTTPSAKDARLLGEAAMARVAKAAGARFMQQARKAAIAYLEKVPHSSTELMTDAIKRAGVKPPKDDRAFGPVYAGLLADKTIVKIGDCKRRKGHGTSGGSVVALASKWPADAKEAA